MIIWFKLYGFFLIVCFFFSSALLRNEVGWYDEEEHNSSLVAARLATDAADVKSAIAERISVILQNMTSLLTSFIVAFIVEWRVSLLILGTFPLLVLANFAQVTTKDSNPLQFLTQNDSMLFGYSKKIQQGYFGYIRIFLCLFVS